MSVLFLLIDKSVIVLPAQQTIRATINCDSGMEPKGPRLRFGGTSQRARLVIATKYVVTYEIASTDSGDQLVTIELPTNLVGHCSVTASSKHALVDIYPVIKGERGQLYASYSQGQ